MVTSNPAIFRPEALRYRLQNQGRRRAEVTLPRLMAHRFMVILWILLGVLGVGGGLACLPAVPVSAAGLAIVTTETRVDSKAPVIAVLMPAEHHDRLEPGHAASVLLGTGGTGLDGTIVAIEPEPLTSAEVGERLGLPYSALSMLQGPVTLTWVTLDRQSPADIGMDNVGRADLEIGVRRAGTFLPLVGRLFEE